MLTKVKQQKFVFFSFCDFFYTADAVFIFIVIGCFEYAMNT